MEGSGKFMITAVGLSSNKGIIMSLLGATEDLEEPEEDEEGKFEFKKNAFLSWNLEDYF